MTETTAPAAEPGAPSFARLRDDVQREVAKVVVGQAAVVDAVLAAVAVGGHLLLQGPPGVAKSLLSSAVARATGLGWRRVQFTPDMLPSDLTGTLVLTGSELRFRPGPVFTNLLLADEINRTPPKTQAALLEAMQERQVTIDGVAHPLPEPFTVLGTLNPIEYEGTYPLPEAQLDRFVMQLTVGYPAPAEELEILRLRHAGVAPVTLDDVAPVGSPAALHAARVEVDAVTVSDEVVAYVAALVQRTRELPSVVLGASPRAAVHLLAVSRAWAALAGRGYVVPDDVAALAGPCLHHRLVLSPEAELDRFTPAQAMATVVATVPIPR